MKNQRIWFKNNKKYYCKFLYKTTIVEIGFEEKRYCYIAYPEKCAVSAQNGLPIEENYENNFSIENLFENLHKELLTIEQEPKHKCP